MSGEDNSNNEAMMELMKSMFSSMSDMNHNMNNLIEDITNNYEVVNARFESLQDKINLRAISRAVSPSTLAAKLNAKIKVEPVDLVTDMPRAYAPREDKSMTALMKNNEDANAFADANPMPKQRKPVESKRMNTHAWGDSYAAVDRQNNPTQRGIFTTATPEVTAYLDADKVPRVRASTTGVFPAIQYRDSLHEPDIQQSQVCDTCTL
jgi:hypothetical protein